MFQKNYLYSDKISSDFPFADKFFYHYNGLDYLQNTL